MSQVGSPTAAGGQNDDDYIIPRAPEKKANYLVGPDGLPSTGEMLSHPRDGVTLMKTIIRTDKGTYWKENKVNDEGMPLEMEEFIKADASKRRTLIMQDMQAQPSKRRPTMLGNMNIQYGAAANVVDV